MAEKDRFIKSENKRICFYIPPEDKKALEMIAAKENRTVSAVVLSAVEKYFTNISAVAELLDRDRYSSFEKIEKIARRKALLYANTKSFDGLEGFLDDEKIRQIQCELVSKEYAPSDNYDNLDYTDFDY